MFDDWGVDSIMLVLVAVGYDVCWLDCGRYHGWIVDGIMVVQVTVGCDVC